jgi:hypothetical protein
VLGFTGYAVASLLAAVLFDAWQLPLFDRLVGAFAPPLAFLVVLSVVRTLVGRERIVFYQVATSGVGLVAAVAALASGHVARLIDIATVGIGAFLVFGRLGCFSVACCHGRPARFGVVYGPAHVRVGLSELFAGRPLWPSQLVESAASLALVLIALGFGWDTPGVPAVIYIAGYAPLRFALELVRGDGERPYRLGASEAQWTAAATAIAVAVWRPGPATLGLAFALVAALVTMVARRQRRELVLSPHVHELGRLRAAAGQHREPLETSLGVAISCYPLPDGRLDWVLSASHPSWSAETARRLAADLWPGGEVVLGRTPGVIHVIAARSDRAPG